MDQIRKLELSLLDQYEKIPHLPEGLRKWLAENAWWLVLIGVVLSVIGLFFLLFGWVLLMFGLGIGGSMVLGVPGAAAGIALGGVVLIVTLLSVAFYLLEMVLLGMAVTPLRTLQKKGWDLLFIVAVINVAFAIIVGVLSLQLGSLVFGLLWAAIGVYFLFEVRDYFVIKKVPEKPALTKK